METIYLVENEDDWVILNDAKQMKILKPPYHPKAGHPKANWKSSQGEKKKALHHCCSCGGQCHNRSTCKYIMPTPSTVNGLASRVAQMD